MLAARAIHRTCFGCRANRVIGDILQLMRAQESGA